MQQAIRRRWSSALLAVTVALTGLTLMATPAHAAEITLRGSTSSDNGAGATTLELSVPIGTQENDVMLAQVTIEGQSNVEVTPPEGWTLEDSASRANDLVQKIYSKVATDAELVSQTWTFDESRRASGGIVVYDGVRTADPIDDIDASSQTGTTLTAPSVTTSEDGGRLVVFFGINNNATLTTPTGMTELYEHPNTTGTLPTSSANDEPRPTAGDTESRASTASAEGAWVAHSVALFVSNDEDEDGVINDEDNCPDVANPDQANNDEDDEGDVCDTDDDNDTFSDEEEINAGSDPQDENSTPEVCGDDIDNDGNDGTDEDCTIRVESNVTIKGDGTPFHGDVRAEGRKKCINNRTVKLWKKRSGPDLAIGTDETNEEGEWQKGAGSNPNGTYYAKVLRKEFERNDGVTVICKAARSEDRSV
jgi:hypothetical protein